MINPITIGTAAVTATPINRHRELVRFQNAGTTIIYLKKIPFTGPFSIVTPTDFEIVLAPFKSATGAPEVFETDSPSSFMAISSAACGLLAIYETKNIYHCGRRLF